MSQLSSASDPAGELRALPRPPSWIKGSLLLSGEEEWQGRERRAGEKRERGGKRVWQDGEGRKGEAYF